MVWFYERQGSFIRCEARESAGSTGFDLMIIHPDGVEVIEHFDDSPSLERRQRELEQALAGDGWQGPFGRTI